MSIVWPRSGQGFSDEDFKIKADATDSDGYIVRVEFFANTNLIGAVTNPPWNVVWQAFAKEHDLFAVAEDNSGAKTWSKPARIYGGLERPAFPVVEIVSPRNGAYFAAPATFAFSAEVLASLGDAGPVEFLIDSNSIALVDARTRLTATTPPSSVTVSNLQEGGYKLTVRYHGENGGGCTCNSITNTIRVVNLAVQSARLTDTGRVQFEVVTSFPGVETVIEASANLRDWSPISTNTPAGNTFLFTDETPVSDLRRFYQVRLPSQ